MKLVSVIQDNSCFEHTGTMGIVLVVLELPHNWILTLNSHLWPFWRAAHWALFKNTHFSPIKTEKVLKYETRHIVSSETLSSNQLVRKPPKKFFKQKKWDSLEERIILTNDNILPMKRSMCFLLVTWSTRSCSKKQNLGKLVAIKTCRPCLFQMTCNADRPWHCPLTALCNGSGLSYRPTTPSYTG